MAELPGDLSEVNTNATEETSSLYRAEGDVPFDGDIPAEQLVTGSLHREIAQAPYDQEGSLTSQPVEGADTSGAVLFSERTVVSDVLKREKYGINKTPSTESDSSRESDDLAGHTELEQGTYTSQALIEPEEGWGCTLSPASLQYALLKCLCQRS